MNMSARFGRLLVLGLLVTLVLAACGGTGSAPIKVGSKDFTEEFIVGEMYALMLENEGFKVERKLNLGGSPVAHEAIKKGEIDLYPEYTSTGLLTILKKDPIADPAQILATVKSEYEKQFQLTWLNASPFNDTNGLATTKAIADKYGIKTYSDLATKAPELRLGGPAEFAEREDGIKGLQKTYGGFQFKEFKQLGTGPLRYDGLKNGDVDVVVVFTTDARIAADKLVVLQDDKTFYPIYNIAPVVRQDTLQKNPKIADALNRLAPLLTDDVIAGLNAQVDIDKKEFAAVAKAFLDQADLLKK
ncbi:MAG TPA: glycine betaine ABC transporter substrate-binding protein [Roseiflexaceae bacterium]|nr:glycine betaine ABC transporter substrate-binding protein [Roseiflexaceae bacterium]